MFAMNTMLKQFSLLLICLLFIISSQSFAFPYRCMMDEIGTHKTWLGQHHVTHDSYLVFIALERVGFQANDPNDLFLFSKDSLIMKKLLT